MKKVVRCFTKSMLYEGMCYTPLLNVSMCCLSLTYISIPFTVHVPSLLLPLCHQTLSLFVAYLPQTDSVM